MPAALNFSCCQVSMKKPRASPKTSGSISTASAIGVLVNFMRPTASNLRLFVDDAQQIFAIAALFQRPSQFYQLIRADESRAPGDLFDASDFEALSLLDDAHEHTGIEQGIVRSGIEPCGTAAQQLNVQFADLEVCTVQIRDFQLSPRRGGQCLRKSWGPSIVKVNPSHRMIRRRCYRLFQKVRHPALRVELNDPVALRILHVVAEYRRTGV